MIYAGLKGADKPDPRDWNMDKLRLAVGAPDECQIAVPQILDQKDLGSCVVNALALGIQIAESSAVNPAPEILSRLYAYWVARNQHNDTDNDGGTFIRLAIKALNRLGRPPESAYPYQTAKYREKPPMALFIKAHEQRAAKYYRIAEYGERRIDAVKMAIANGHPVVFGADIDQHFAAYRGGNRKPFQPPTGNIVGGHAQVITGYDVTTATVTNSWGKSWGDYGQSKFSWSYITWERTRDLWAIAI